MKLNAYILLEQMDGIEDHYFHSSPLTRTLAHLTILDNEIPLRSDCIYISQSIGMPTVAPTQVPYTLICAGKPLARYLTDSYCDLLCCRKEYTTSMIFSMLYQIISKYDKWEDALLESLIQKKGPQHLCELSIPIFENPIMLLGENHELLVVAEKGERYRVPYEYRQKDTDYLSETVLNDLLLDPEYPKTFSYTTPEFYTGADGIQCIYMNIFIDDRYAARICIDGITRYPSNADKALMCVFAKMIESALRESSYSSYNSLANFKKYLLLYINTETHEEKELLSRNLVQVHWSAHDKYFCIVLQPNERDFQGKGIIHDCNMLEKKYLGCIAVIVEKDILLLCNLRVSPLSRNELLADIIYTVREKLMKSGVSTIYDNFFDLPIYYKQAKYALDTGKAYNEMVWQYKFEDYALSFVLDHGVKALPLKALLPQGLVSIMNYDKEHNSSYYLTLRTFIENDMSPAKAIDALYIHRSTFKYRIKKIQEMLDLDLELPHTKLYLLILFHVIEENSK